MTLIYTDEKLQLGSFFKICKYRVSPCSPVGEVCLPHKINEINGLAFEIPLPSGFKRGYIGSWSDAALFVHCDGFGPAFFRDVAFSGGMYGDAQGLLLPYGDGGGSRVAL
jgi:hypothetical protein